MLRFWMNCGKHSTWCRHTMGDKRFGTGTRTLGGKTFGVVTDTATGLVMLLPPDKTESLASRLEAEPQYVRNFTWRADEGA